MDKAAETRLKNDQVRAARQSMGTNLAARNSLRPTGGSKMARKSRSVGALVQPGRLPFNVPGEPPKPPVGPQMSQPQQNAPMVDPEVERLIDKVHLEKLMTSPEIQDAVAVQDLSDYYNGRVPGGIGRGARIKDVIQQQIMAAGG